MLIHDRQSSSTSRLTGWYSYSQLAVYFDVKRKDITALSAKMQVALNKKMQVALKPFLSRS
jgi:hypothetical protein